MTDIRRVGDTGINTAEGTISGARASQLSRQREKQIEEYESLKNKIKHDNSALVGRIDAKFDVKLEGGEDEFRKKTVGLVSLTDFRDARAMSSSIAIDSSAQLTDKSSAISKELIAAENLKLKAEKDVKRKKAAMKSLSFAADDDAEEVDEEFATFNKRPKKNPFVDTSFLPDKERDINIATKRQELTEEWLNQQEKMKDDILEVVYSYWDGSGHRKEIKLKKGYTINKFLSLVKDSLVKEFPELRSVSTAGLMYVKEDLIIPNHITFYDLIVTKARGKSGPLFNFGVKDDIRLIDDVRVEKDDSHPGKVIDRRWYEKNKHIFPASRWEIYDINKSYGTQYTIHGK